MYKPGRMIGAFTTFLNRVLIFALSGGLLVLAVAPDLAGTVGGENAPLLSAERVVQFRAVVIAFSLFLLCLNLNIIQFVLFNIWNNEGRRYISSRTASGTARVNLDAIQRSLHALADAMPEIARSRLQVLRTGHTRYKVSVLFWMKDGRNVINISEKLRLLLKKRFSDLVSISPRDRVDFDITLAGIGKGRKGGRQDRGGADDTQSQFKGPVYPVEGES